MSSPTTLSLNKRRRHFRWTVATRDPNIILCGHHLHGVIPQDDGSYHGWFETRVPVSLVRARILCAPDVIDAQHSKEVG
jgi:hypothetical protein